MKTRLMLTAALTTLVLTTMRAAESQVRTPAPAAAARKTPALVVLLVVDQFRGDYVRKYGGMWTKGLHRLVENGAYFPLAAYPYAGTVTCAGHNTIGTGSFPRTHGMIGNAWYDRDLKKSVACTADPSVTSVPYG